MARQLLKGNEAVVKGALLAGCRAFYGYPITPATEILESAAWYVPRTGGVFLQAESEVAAIQMVYGAAAAGQRAMTASSGPGISLMSEAISYLAGAELPCVIVDITRAGPGLGNISPEQSDYWQVTRNGGHGSYRSLVLAPASVQEMADLTRLAFDLADRYRNPVFLLADGTIGQMMEPVEFREPARPPVMPEWAVDGTAATRRNLISSIFLLPDDLESHIAKLEAKYALAAQQEVRWESYRTGDAELVLVGYGIVARILRHAVDELRSRGIAAGLLRPITLFPFPSAELRRLAGTVREFTVVEMSTGQMIDDVRLALEGAATVSFYGRGGGNLPSAEEIVAFVEGRVRKEVLANA
jgi:pyruvate/2-oxoacid:ferredoxin oxidoreductase alpha subunit